MESAEKEKNAIISGIELDARAEEQQIIQEAEHQATEKRMYNEKKIESVLNDAHDEARQKAESFKRKMISGVQLEIKRRSMHIHDAVIHEIMDKVEKKLNSMCCNADYRTVLVKWITEAAIGLDAESARINASEKELVLTNDQLISEVTEKVRAKTGRKMSLQLSEELPLKSQGVVLTSADGRTAFNNQVKTRILRKEREIRMAIYNTLFADDRKEE